MASWALAGSGHAGRGTSLPAVARCRAA